MHRHCTACVVQTHHATRVAQDIWIVCHKKVLHPLAKSHQLLHITPNTCTSSPTSPVPDQPSFSHCDDLRPPLQGGTSTEQPPHTVVQWNLVNPRDNEQNPRSSKSMKITLKVKELLRWHIITWCISLSRCHKEEKLSREKSQEPWTFLESEPWNCPEADVTGKPVATGTPENIGKSEAQGRIWPHNFHFL